MRVPLDAAGEARCQRLMADLLLIDLHQHPVVLPDAPARFTEYLRGASYRWGFEAVRAGGWSTVATANAFRAAARSGDMSFVDFDDLVDELAEMLGDVRASAGVGVVCSADAIEAARANGTIGFLPTLEHLGIGHDLRRLDLLYTMGVRLAGLTYAKRNLLGDGLLERSDAGLSELGVAAIERMNDLGIAVDLSHAGHTTALEAIACSRAPVIFSHNASYTLRPTRRTRTDEELTLCAAKGGLIAITAVPNSLRDDPAQDIGCVLDHYDYMVRLVGVEHVGIGTDTLIGDHVGYHRVMMGRSGPDAFPTPYLNGLESPADGSNIVRGLIARGYDDAQVRAIAGGNALSYFRRVWK
ncbi:MAG TPA: membrane dipeptidase [Dehalococcoidia bacterium]|nr:membrane dipeptidase [Dehalococcoidia bacterium]